MRKGVRHIIARLLRNFALLVVILATASCSGLRVSNLPSQDTYETAQDRVDARLREAEVPVAVPLVENWVHNSSGAFGPGAPIVIGSYLATGTRSGDLLVVSTESGKKVGSENFGDSINGALALYKSKLIVPVSWGSKRGIVAHDLARGATAWQLRVPPVDTGLLLVDDTVFFVDHTSVLRAIQAEDGADIWVTEFDRRVPFEASPLELTDALIAVVDAKGIMTAVDKRTGQTVWAVELHEPVYTDMDTDGITTFVTSTRGSIFAINNANGSMSWNRKVGEGNVRITSPTLYGESVIVGTSSGWVISMDRSTGDVLWELSVDEAIAAAPLVTRDYIFVSSMDRLVRGIDRESGEVVWTTELKGRAKSKMIARDNQLFILSEPRLVYNFISDNEEIARAK